MRRFSLPKGLIKWLLTVLLITVGILSATGALDEAVWHTSAGQMDMRAGDSFDGALARAAYTFAVVRALNAVTSVIKDTEIAVVHLALKNRPSAGISARISTSSGCGARTSTPATQTPKGPQLGPSICVARASSQTPGGKCLIGQRHFRS